MQNLNSEQYPVWKQIVYHFYPGIFIVVAYMFLSQFLLTIELPSFLALLIVEVAVLVPIALTHLYLKAGNSFNFKKVIPYLNKVKPAKFIMWTLIGFFGCIILYIPLYPLGILLKETAFDWLPPWYFDPMYGATNPSTVANIFLIAIVTDGIIAPAIEEVYFRGYLLPRMAFLKNWAPVLNGLMFGLYHFWQPHNYFAIIIIGTIISFIVWKTKNVWLGIAIHCTLNTAGALMGYFAVTSGTMIGR